mmetsp:Transcript_37499/g.90453  ORF Transcript_37499/g.90453 Transcript_37499/m.90453 type:complete len:238 (+) Transcript_37499:865-1578(+)
MVRRRRPAPPAGGRARESQPRSLQQSDRSPPRQEGRGGCAREPYAMGRLLLQPIQPGREDGHARREDAQLLQIDEGECRVHGHEGGRHEYVLAGREQDHVLHASSKVHCLRCGEEGWVRGEGAVGVRGGDRYYGRTMGQSTAFSFSRAGQHVQGRLLQQMLQVSRQGYWTSSAVARHSQRRSRSRGAGPRPRLPRALAEPGPSRQDVVPDGHGEPRIYETQPGQQCRLALPAIAVHR